MAVCQSFEQAIAATGGAGNAAMGEWLSARTKDDQVRTVFGSFSWDRVGLPVDKFFLMAQWNDGDLQFVCPLDEFDGVKPMPYPKNGF